MDLDSGNLERFRMLIESIDDWLWEVDADGLYTYSSPQVEHILGYSPDEVIGKSPLAFMTPEAAREVRARYRDILAKHRSFRLVETAHLHKDGHLVHIETSGRPIFDANGLFLGLRGLDRDITARKEADNLKNNLLAAVDQMAEVALFLDADGIITYVNQAFYDLLGYEAQEVIGQPVAMLDPNSRFSHTTEQVIEKMRVEGAWEGEVMRRKSDGSYLPVYLHATTIYDGSEVIGYTGTYLDLSNIRQTEQKLRESYRGTITAIAMTIEKRDPYTAGHQNNVAVLSEKIARKLGKHEEFINGLVLGALIHDIGKIHIPSEILTYPGKLSTTEYELIKTHAEIGHEILRGVAFPWPVAQMVRQHHEKLDGSGYPDGLTGDEMLEEAKIIAVADVVDAVTSHRPYRPALPLGHAVEIIVAGRGAHYDPAVVDAMLALIEKDDFELRKPAT